MFTIAGGILLAIGALIGLVIAFYVTCIVIGTICIPLCYLMDAWEKVEDWIWGRS